jgi:hypothetical protein
MSPVEAVGLSTALHLGFSAVVTAAVYPALAEVSPARFAAAHRAHMRRMSIVVGPIYLAMAAAFGWALLRACCSTGLVVSALAAACAVLVSVTLAVPTHQRLGIHGPTPALLRRLLQVDRLRLVAAAVAFGAGLLA